MKIIKKIFISILVVFVFVFKPVYSLIFILLFSFEYLFFISFILNILKNWDSYYIIAVNNIDLNDKSILDIWVEFCRLQAFRRIYLVLLRKGFSLKNLFVCFLLICFGIPLKFLKLCLYFFKSPYSFRKSLEMLYYENFYVVNNWKIEFLNKKLYLTPFNLVGFIFYLKESKVSNEKIYKTYIAIQNLYRKWDEIDNKRQKVVELRQMQGLDNSGKPLWSPHYGILEKGNTIHVTSNVPIKIVSKELITDFDEKNQWYDIPMKSTILKDAKNPGSVISTKVAQVKWGHKKIFIPKNEVDNLKYFNQNTFDLEPSDVSFIRERDVEVNSILLSYLQDKYYTLDKDFKKHIISGNYKTAILNSTDIDFLETLNRRGSEHSDDV